MKKNMLFSQPLTTCRVEVITKMERTDSMPLNGHFRNRLIGGTDSISKAYLRAEFQGISPQNMAQNIVLTYLHFRILEMGKISPLPCRITPRLKIRWVDLKLSHPKAT